MKLLIDIAEMENHIISAIEDTSILCCDNWNGKQSEIWDKVYKAMNLLREKALPLTEVAKKEGYILTNEADAIHASEH